MGVSLAIGSGVLVFGTGKPADELTAQLALVAPGVARPGPDGRAAGRVLVVVVAPAPGEALPVAANNARRSWPGIPLVVWAVSPPAAEIVQVMRLPRVDVVLAEEGAKSVLAAAERAVPSLVAAAGAAAPVALVGPVTPPPAVGRPAVRAPAAARADELPVLDQRLGIVQQWMAREEVSIGDVESLVASEPRLVTVVVRTANSAYYHAPRAITNLHDAVVRIGVRQTLAVLFETLVQHAFHPMHPEAQAVLTAAWENAGLTARFARRLAEWESLGRSEDVYLAALLHNVGECLLVWRLYRGPVRPGQLAEEAPRIAAHHESAAELAMERWGMPPLVASLAAFHHRARLGETPRDAALRRAILGSWALARRLQGDYLPDMPEPDSALELPYSLTQRLVQLAAPEYVGHPAISGETAATG